MRLTGRRDLKHDGVGVQHHKTTTARGSRMDIAGVQFSRKENLFFVRDLAGTERYKYRLLNPFVDHNLFLIITTSAHQPTPNLQLQHTQDHPNPTQQQNEVHHHRHPPPPGWLRPRPARRVRHSQGVPYRGRGQKLCRRHGYLLRRSQPGRQPDRHRLAPQ